jgi:hypothetical protein
MAQVVAQAPVAFSAMTSATGTSAQLWQVSAAGVTAGLTAGNFYLDSPSSNLLNGRRFEVTYGGWIKAHGATQGVYMGMQIFPWNTTVSGARTASGTNTYTPLSSISLTAGTFYDFVVTQQFFGESNANTLTFFAPVVYVAGSQVTIASSSSLTGGVTVAFASASQTEPITGVNTTTDYPLASFVPTIQNGVSDTTQTMQLTTFNLQVV